MKDKMQRISDALYTLARKRNDIYAEGILGVSELDAAEPMGPEKVMRYLKVTGDELLELVRCGPIVRPGKRSKGRVAWRADEIVPHRDWIAERREDGLTLL